MQDHWPLSSIFCWLDIRACQDGNGDGMGDIPGLISRLDHFQEVGIGALLFPGLQPSDFAYGGTMMTGFCDVDPRFGTLDDFGRLVQEAHKREIAILPGWSPFSTHPDHPFFQASRDPEHPKHDEYRDCFLWVQDINSRQPRRWGHWQWDEKRKAYYHAVWLTVDHRWCPEVNLVSGRAREENRRVVRFWLDRGVDGFWVDCGVWGGFMTKEDHVRFSREMTELVHSYPNRWIISEGSKSIEAAVEEDGYDSFFADQARSVPVYKTVYRQPGTGTLVEFFPGMESHGIHEALYSFYDDPHGNRIMHPLKIKAPLDFADPKEVARARLLYVLHATLPLVPLFWFPGHAGLERVKRGELVNRYPFLMMWDDTKNYGFSDVDPYIPQNEEGYPDSAAVESQLKDPESPLSCFKAVANLRRETPALQCRYGVSESYGRIPTDRDDDIFAYLRFEPVSRQAVIVIVNLAEEKIDGTLLFHRSSWVLERLRGKSRFAVRLGKAKLGETELVTAAEDGPGAEEDSPVFANCEIELECLGYAIIEIQ